MLVACYRFLCSPRFWEKWSEGFQRHSLQRQLWSGLKSEAAAWRHWALARLAMSRRAEVPRGMRPHAPMLRCPAFRLIVCGETPESLGKARSCVSMLQCSSPRAQEVGGPISRLDRRGGCGSDVFRQSDLSRPGRSGPFSIFTVSRHCPATSSPLAYWRPCPLSPARPQWGLDSYMGKRRHQRDHVQLVRRSLAVLCAGPAAEAKDPCAAAGACCSVPRRSGASF